ncbi:YraN family protein [Novosphingobium sp. Chol11]|uniref:YraN family protein n=1 Tax=Novosphingobium sp. Chol11 TaxID=1385763 RepID=UPI0025E15579|nr:YraN family protein [Novosphingobium sp. Chol11]
MSRAEAERQGRRGEMLAAWYLRLKGWRVLARRQKIGVGEVDLIARKGRTVAFIEVKWRSSGAALDQAIDARRLRRVARAAEALAPRFSNPGDDLRIDVILIAPGQWPRQIANVWQPGA